MRRVEWIVIYEFKVRNGGDRGGTRWNFGGLKWRVLIGGEGRNRRS